MEHFSCRYEQPALCKCLGKVALNYRILSWRGKAFKGFSFHINQSHNCTCTPKHAKTFTSDSCYMATSIRETVGGETFARVSRSPIPVENSTRLIKEVGLGLVL